MKAICICGGGSLGHVMAAVLGSHNDVKINILTGHPEAWGGFVSAIDSNGKNYIAEIKKVSSKASDVDAQESIISQVAGKIMAVAEAYPDLKSNTNYQNLMNSLDSYESKVRQSRLVYNDTVTKLNRTIRMFPTSLIAPMFGIFARDYLKTEESKTEMPSMK